MKGIQACESNGTIKIDKEKPAFKPIHSFFEKMQNIYEIQVIMLHSFTLLLRT